MLHTLFCAVFWAIIFSFVFNKVISVITQGLAHVQKLHQIPCAKCIYFTGDYRLKCPVNPKIALSEEAINCRDFQVQFICDFNNLQASQKIPHSK